MIFFKNKDEEKNIGVQSGKKFVVMFEIKSYVLREDGTKDLIKEDGTHDLILFLKDKNNELIPYFSKEAIEW